MKSIDTVKKDRRRIYNCPVCNQEMGIANINWKSGYCNNCYRLYRRVMFYHDRCVKCGKPTFGYTFKDRVCRSCGNSNERNPNHGNGYKILGENNPNYGNGEKISGDKNPNWNGGTSKLPYSFSFNKALKETIKQRDNYTCQLCPSTEDLTIHHIDYDKQNCEKTNLITLCRGCNARVNYGREKWLKHFKERIPNEVL